jgi:hypothetical protein
MQLHALPLPLLSFLLPMLLDEQRAKLLEVPLPLHKPLLLLNRECTMF